MMYLLLDILHNCFPSLCLSVKREKIHRLFFIFSPIFFYLGQSCVFSWHTVIICIKTHRIGKASYLFPGFNWHSLSSLKQKLSFSYVFVQCLAQWGPWLGAPRHYRSINNNFIFLAQDRKSRTLLLVATVQGRLSSRIVQGGCESEVSGRWGSLCSYHHTILYSAAHRQATWEKNL